MADTDKLSNMPAAGPVGRNLLAALDELALARGYSMRRLSAALEETGRPIPPLGLARILKGERRVDADEVMALAVVLGVNPNALLLPRHVGRDDEVELTPEVRQRSHVAWAWADGVCPLPGKMPPPGAVAISTPGDKWADWVTHARPAHAAPDPDPAAAELLTLIRMLEAVLADPERTQAWEQWRDTILRRFRLAAIQLEELFARLDREAMAATGFPADPAELRRLVNETVQSVRIPATGFAAGTEERYRAGAQADRDRAGPAFRHGDNAGAARTVDPLDPFAERKNEP